ncbi:MAG: polysaccharide biosynthesis protein [Spirochaetales bacterium]|nr:polysaccharide biosynthesis protein [Spirochaetales bacterium]
MKKRALIIGAGVAGKMVCNDMQRQGKIRDEYEIIGFIDDDPAKQSVCGIDVIGAIKDLPDILEWEQPDEVLIAIPSAPQNVISDIIDKIPPGCTKLRIIPGIYDIIQGEANWKQLRTVRPEDLLGREEVGMEYDKTDDIYKDKTVLITGAGGSIGSEIVRNVLRLPIRKLVALGRGENSIYNLIEEFRSESRFTYIIGDIRDKNKLSHEFTKHKPDIVFHAAAHKHVPLMEDYPDEAVKNNILGTNNVLQAAISADVERFLLISTDKAVRPTSVMGATKRIAELLVSGYNYMQDTTHCTIVRFGNVLASRGSVIPTFMRQIESGGPITLTHPDIERYFMSIPEAARLVIKAVCIPQSPTEQNAFVLDMGQPIRIMDLAKNLIRLSGHTEGEIPIKIIGLRPGEKLYEELSYDKTKLKPSEFDKILWTGESRRQISKEEIQTMIDEFRAAAESYDRDRILALIKQYVPEFRE